jgi:hypothetical protein
MSPQRTQSPGRLSKALAAGLAVLTGALACSDATDVELLQIRGSGVLFGQAFVDLDGDGLLGSQDPPMADVDVLLVTSTSARVVQLTTTDENGAFSLFEVPVGTYLLSIDASALGDTLEMFGSGDPISVQLGDTSQVNLGATYPTRTIEEILTAPVGTTVFTSGIALNSRNNADPAGQVHFSGETAYLRALNVERSGVATGDSVRLLGRVVSDNGRPAIDQVTPTVLVSGAALPIPVETTVAAASTADGGTLDAALVRIRTVEIADTATAADGNFHFWAVDGADSVEVVLRSFLGFDTTDFGPGVVRLAQGTGLLSPVDDGVGIVRWRLLPRAGSDMVLEPALAAVQER